VVCLYHCKAILNLKGIVPWFIPGFVQGQVMSPDCQVHDHDICLSNQYVIYCHIYQFRIRYNVCRPGLCRICRQLTYLCKMWRHCKTRDKVWKNTIKDRYRRDDIKIPILVQTELVISGGQVCQICRGFALVSIVQVYFCTGRN